MKFKKTKPINTLNTDAIVGGDIKPQGASSHKPKLLMIGFLVVSLIVASAIGYYLYDKDKQDSKDTVAQSEANYKEKLDKANSNPEDIAAQNEAAVATGQLAQDYVQSGNTDKAIEVSSGGDTISKLEAQSVALQQKGDWAGALAVHKQLLEEYKKLPDDNPIKKAEIERAERKIQELSERV